MYVCMYMRSGQESTVHNDEVADLTSQETLQLLGMKKRFLSSPKHPNRFNGPASLLLLQRLGSKGIKLHLVPRLNEWIYALTPLVLMVRAGTTLHLRP